MDEEVGPKSGVSRPEWTSEDEFYISDKAKDLLVNYSGILDTNIRTHSVAVRDKAWEIFPYRCIGTFRFLDFTLLRNPAYDEILTRIKQGQKFLDIGCCLGSDVRALLYDGAPACNVFGLDIEAEFINLGYDLFVDEEKLARHHFRIASIFDETIARPDGTLGDLAGNIDIVHCGAFLHLFEWDGQVRTIEKIILEILVQKRGCLILGRQKGCKVPGTYDHSFREQKIYGHNETSFKAMWKEIGDRTGTDWKVDFTFEGDLIDGSGESSRLAILKSGSNTEGDRQAAQNFSFKAERMM